jgi:hypothetical protein
MISRVKLEALRKVIEGALARDDVHWMLWCYDGDEQQVIRSDDGRSDGKANDAGAARGAGSKGV